MPKRSFFDLRDSRKRQSISRETCGTPANTKAFPVGLAGVPANAKANAARLAGVPANAKAFPVGLAGFPQTPKHFPWDLRNFRGAFPKALWPLTARDQRHSPGIRESILSSNSRCLRDHLFPIGHSMQNAFEVPSPIRNGIFRAYSLRLPVIF